MTRVHSAIIASGLVLGAANPVLALGPVNQGQALVSPDQSLIIQVRPMTERQKCKALNRCRQKYTHCYNKLERQHRIADKDTVCVPPYQKCINASFSGTDWFFTRWFNPSYLDCRQYPG